MGCEGMRRPGGEGARLRFSGSIGTGENERQLALILAMPYLVEGAVGNEQPTRVTLIEEDQGRFFSTQENDTCWSDIYEQERDTSAASGDKAYRIRGLLYCVAPVPELNGDGSVTLGDIEFDGRVSWRITP